MTGLLAFDGAVGIAIGSLIRNRSLSVIGDGPLTEHDRALGIHTLEHSNDHFLHNDPWSSLLDAWSEAYPRLRQTIM
jgi:hypothetical protein